jgi:hypothetical protein
LSSSGALCIDIFWSKLLHQPFFASALSMGFTLIVAIVTDFEVTLCGSIN